MPQTFIAAAQAIADHFKNAEAKRGSLYRDLLKNPMLDDEETLNYVGIPVVMLRALLSAKAPQGAEDGARFEPLVTAILDLEGPNAQFLMAAKVPTTIDEVRALIDQMVAASGQGGAA